MDERVERLWGKAEAAIDRNDNEQADSYRSLAGHVAWHRRKDAREMDRAFEYVRQEDE